MTLETAKRMVDAGKPSKEAEAVIRGGMTICEKKEDGSRKYVWIKVEPTLSDAESSIRQAMDKHEKKKQIKKKVNHKEPIVEETDSMPSIEDKETQLMKTEIDSFINRLKKKAKKIWQEIDSVVIE